jgi:hypothetical protein
VDVALVLAELALQQFLNIGAILGREPALLDEYVGQGSGLGGAPQGAGTGKLVIVDQVGLEGEYAEE